MKEARIWYLSFCKYCCPAPITVGGSPPLIFEQHRRWADCGASSIWAPGATRTSVLMAPSDLCSLILHLFFSSHTDNYLFHHQLITSHEKPDLIQACLTKWGKIVLNRTGSPKIIFCSKIGLTSNWPLMEACWGWLGPFCHLDTGALSPKPLEFGHQPERASNSLAASGWPVGW